MVDPVITAADVEEGRRIAEAQMRDVCTITKPGEGLGPWNADTMQYDPPDDITVYGPTIDPHLGKCRIQIPGDSVNARDVESGEARWTLQTAIVQLPVSDTEMVRVNQIVTVEAAELDQALVGRKYRVDGLHHKSQASCRRLRCEEVTGR